MLGFNEVKEMMNEMVDALVYDEDTKITDEVIEKKVNAFWKKLKKDNKLDLQFHLGLKKLESCPTSIINRIKRERDSWLKSVEAILAKKG